MKTKKKYRKYNYQASEPREKDTIHLHPALAEGLRKIARYEKKSLTWLIETALSDYFGIEVMLKEFKSQPLEEYTPNGLNRR